MSASIWIHASPDSADHLCNGSLLRIGSDHLFTSKTLGRLTFYRPTIDNDRIICGNDWPSRQELSPVDQIYASYNGYNSTKPLDKAEPDIESGSFTYYAFSVFIMMDFNELMNNCT